MYGIKLTGGKSIPKSLDFSQVYGRCLKHCLLTSVTMDIKKQTGMRGRHGKPAFVFKTVIFFLVDTNFSKMLISKKDLPFLPTEALFLSAVSNGLCLCSTCGLEF